MYVQNATIKTHLQPVDVEHCFHLHELHTNQMKDTCIEHLQGISFKVTGNPKKIFVGSLFTAAKKTLNLLT